MAEVSDVGCIYKRHLRFGSRISTCCHLMLLWFPGTLFSTVCTDFVKTLREDFAFERGMDIFMCSVFCPNNKNREFGIGYQNYYPILICI